MQLIYRGQSFDYTPAATPTYQKPHALNWRYQNKGETYGEIPLSLPSYSQPRGLNWRYQIAAKG